MSKTNEAELAKEVEHWKAKFQEARGDARDAGVSQREAQAELARMTRRVRLVLDWTEKHSGVPDLIRSVAPIDMGGAKIITDAQMMARRIAYKLRLALDY